MVKQSHKFLAISGGVGGAKLALGLSHVLPPGQLCIVANTGDDFTHMGLKICPDLDTVMYTLADINNKELGWGQTGESWNFLRAIEDLQGETWFQLGDRDLATHCVRTHLLDDGKTLSEATRHLSSALGIKHALCPMTDDDVATVVHCRSGISLAFQHYFVRDRCQPGVTGFTFQGITNAKPSAGFMEALGDPNLAAVIICPSNPFVSVDPVLGLPGVESLLNDSRAPIIAVSPIVGGQAIKGPAAKMMTELGMPATSLAIAKYYVGRIDGLVIDEKDKELQSTIEQLGIKTIVTNTLMVTLQDRINVAEVAIEFAHQLSESLK